MNILCISDTHGKHSKLKVRECDVLIVSGDICSSGDIWEFESFIDWLATQESKFRKAFLVAGNHDWCLMRQKALAVDIITAKFGDKVQYLEDSECIFDGIKFYGSPWQPTFFNWAFNLDRGERLKTVWDNIPLDTQVLITHGPPFGVGDKVDNNHVGCLDLLNRVAQLQNLFLHVFGHIHPGNGHYVSDALPNVNFCNASICNDSYDAVNSAYMFSLINYGSHHSLIADRTFLWE